MSRWTTLRDWRRLDRRWVAYLHWVGWHALSFGISFDLLGPLVELHLPFCFAVVGLGWWDPIKRCGYAYPHNS